MRQNKEYELCKAISTYLKLQYPSVLYHWDLAGLNLSMAQAGMNKALQRDRGFPDLMILEARGKYHGMFLEVKHEDVRLTKKNLDWTTPHIGEQAKYQLELDKRGYWAHFAIGFDAAKLKIDWYLKQ